MTFEEYWHSEYPPLYEVGKAVARAAWEAASLDADELRAALDDVTRQLQERTEALQSVTLEPVNQYTPWVELGVTETQYYKRRYLEMSHENARLTAEVEAASVLLAFHDAGVPGEYDEPSFTLWLDEKRKLETAYQQNRAARVQTTAPGTGKCEKCGQSTRGQSGEYPCPVCGVPAMHDDLQNGCAHRTPMPAGNGKMYCKDCGKYI